METVQLSRTFCTNKLYISTRFFQFFPLPPGYNVFPYKEQKPRRSFSFLTATRSAYRLWTRFSRHLATREWGEPYNAAVGQRFLQQKRGSQSCIIHATLQTWLRRTIFSSPLLKLRLKGRHFMDASEIQQTVKMALIAITLHAFSSPVNTHLVITAYALYR